jgi:HAD superfamily hydrolase (TIGR01509 family)
MHPAHPAPQEDKQTTPASARPSLKAVLFDLDDTLFDHSHSILCAVEALREGYPTLEAAPLEELVYHYSRLLDELHPQVMAGHLTLDESRMERTRRLFARYGVTLSEAEAARLAAHYRAVYQATRRAVPGAHALLERLRPHVRIVLVTNNLIEEQRDKVHQCGLEGLIDELVTWEETGIAKPDPRMFQIALSRVPCSVTEAVMIGDNWEADICGAQRAGLRAIWLNRQGIACPDPSLAREIRALEPVEAILDLLAINAG